ncbi:MAG: HAD family phosphatase [Solobacterium sp.]|nr:HAD family phosphatase [Solobacterium sp.]
MSGRIKAVVFDMGRVLIDFDPAYFIGCLGIFGEDVRKLEREVFQSVEWAMLDRGSISETDAVKAMQKRLPDHLHEAARTLVSMQERPIIEMEGMAGIIRELKENGYRIYLLSNASLRQHDYWPKVPASEYFDGTLISADAGLVKPQPELYRLFLERFGLCAEECFFIDDSIMNVEAAYLVGMTGMVYHRDASEVRQKLQEAGVVIGSAYH